MSRSAGDPQPPGRDSVYRLIQAVMIFDMLLGAALAAAGLTVPIPALAVLGIGLALIGAALFLFFRQLARRAAAQQNARAGEVLVPPRGLHRKE